MSSIVDYTRDTAYNLTVGCPQAIWRSAKYTGKTIVGVTATALSIFSLGKIDSINEYANIYSKKSFNILPRLYIQVIKVINPYSTLSKPIYESILSGKIAFPILDFAFPLRDSSTFITRHLFSRVTMAFGAVVLSVTRVADLALGGIAAVFSVMCLGRVEKINRFANQQLAAIGAVWDICRILRYVVNPHQSHLVN